MDSELFCCENCFEDFFLKRQIMSYKNPGVCSFCNSRSDHCIPPQELESIFTPLTNLYTSINDIFTLEMLKDGYDGEYLWEKLANEWNVFSDVILSGQNADELLKDSEDIFSSTGD